MNLKNINKLINRFNSLPKERYDQAAHLHYCGTPSCIAGHAADIALTEDPEWTENLIEQKSKEFGYAINVDKPYTLQVINNHSLIDLLAQEWLDISVDSCQKLFRGDVTRFNGPENPSPVQAMKVLENLIKTNKVDWSVAT